jgi:beta-glucosidase
MYSFSCLRTSGRVFLLLSCYCYCARVGKKNNSYKCTIPPRSHEHASLVSRLERFSIPRSLSTRSEMARVTFISVFLLTLISLGLALVRTPNYAADIKRAQQLQGSSKNKRNSVPAGYVAAPYYPTPPGGWVSNWTAAYAKAQKVVANMTLAEKVNVTTGVGENMGRCVGNTGSALRFGIPNLCLQDSALGVADTDNVTAFPAGITVGATWNKALAYARGLAMGAEARGKGVNIQLGPVVGPMGRKPRGGRNWEGFGADPVLQAWAGAETVKGIQANGVIATIKHFIGNEQEAYRMDIIPHGLVSS